jgi:hypothetical protein
MTGHPFETEEDHRIQLNSMQKLFDEGHAGSVKENGIPLLSFVPVTLFHLSKNVDIWDKVKDELTYYNSTQDWAFRDNTLKVRKRRQLEVLELIYENLEKRDMTIYFYSTAKAKLEIRRKEKELNRI